MEGKSEVCPFSSSSSSSSSTTTTKASSFTSELFGPKESSSSSTGLFASIFSPSSKVLGRESLRSLVVERKQDCPAENWSSSRHGAPPGGSFDRNEGNNLDMTTKDINSIFSDQRLHPCHLSSSIFYGGQDICNHPQSTTNSSCTNATFKKDRTEDDSGSASRGNWWQGSLYY